MPVSISALHPFPILYLPFHGTQQNKPPKQANCAPVTSRDKIKILFQKCGYNYPSSNSYLSGRINFSGTEIYRLPPVNTRE